MIFSSLTKNSVLSLLLLLLSVQPALSQKDKGLYSFGAYDKNNVYLYGFKNEKDKIKIKPKYEATGYFQQYKICAVKMNGKWGFINRDGDEVIPFQYEDVKELYVKKDGKWGLIDETGKEIIPIRYAALFPTWKWFAVSIDSLKFGFIDSSGKELSAFIYDGMKKYAAEGAIIREKDGSYTMKSPNPLAPARLHGSWGYIDTLFNFVVPPIYKEALDFSPSGFAWLSADGIYYGAISRRNKLVLPFSFRNVGAFDRTGTASADWGTSAGSVMYNGMFTGERSKQTTKVEVVRRDKNDEMIDNGFKAIENKHPKEAVQWFLKSYRNGNVTAARILADYYYGDTSNPESRAAAINWYKTGASHNILYCLMELASMNYEGKVMPKNEQEGFNLLKQIAAYAAAYNFETDLDEDDADQIAYGLYALGETYRKGNITPKDMQQAFYWYSVAAEKGSYDAIDALGDCYYHGEGTTKDFTKALDSYTIAGIMFTNSLYKAGLMHLKGEGTVKNEAEAVKLFKEAALRKDVDAIEILKKMNIK